jgi:hypothetical protein
MENITINVYIGIYAGTENEKRKIAKELFKALVREAKGQGKTVQEMLEQES